MTIEINAKPVEIIPVSLVGVQYDVTPPKTAMAMKMAVNAKVFNDDPAKMIETINEWIVKAFGPKVAKAIDKRLDDDDDLLDVQHIMSLMEAVIEHSTENPTS